MDCAYLSSPDWPANPSLDAGSEYSHSIGQSNTSYQDQNPRHEYTTIRSRSGPQSETDPRMELISEQHMTVFTVSMLIITALKEGCRLAG